MDQIVEVALVEVVWQTLDEDLQIVVLAQVLVLAVLNWNKREIEKFSSSRIE